MNSDRGEERRRQRIEEMEHEMANVRRREARLRKPAALPPTSPLLQVSNPRKRSEQDARTHEEVEAEMLGIQRTQRRKVSSTSTLSLEEQFPTLPSTPKTPKTPKTPWLPDSEEKITVKELPLPAPVGVALRVDGTSRAIYSFENPDYVPVRQTVTIVEKAKSACWSQRLKESLVVAEKDPVAMWDANIDESDGEMYPQLQSVLRCVDPDLDPDSD